MESPSVAPDHRAALRELVARLAGEEVVWALTGSQAHALQGVPVDVHDIDVQTDREGAYRIASLFESAIVRPVRWRPSASIRSHFGELGLHGVTIEIMGAVQKRLPDGSWERPVDVSAHRVFVDLGGDRVPVLTLEHESRAYERLGRPERAALLRSYVKGSSAA